MRKTFVHLSLLTAFLSVFFISKTTFASTYLVNSVADDSDADLTNPLCLTATGSCTLRAAIEQAEAHTNSLDASGFESPDLIQFLDVLAGSNIDITSSLPSIHESITIIGPSSIGGVNPWTIDLSMRGSRFLVFPRLDRDQLVVLRLERLNMVGARERSIVIQNGNSRARSAQVVLVESRVGNNKSGAVSVGRFGQLSMRKSTLEENVSNSVIDSYGAGIYNNEGEVFITDSKIRGNVTNAVNGEGGAIYNHHGLVRVERSLLDENQARYLGSAIVNVEGGEVQLENVTVSHHVTEGSGTVYSERSISHLSMNYVTMTENRARINSAGLVGNGTEIVVKNSIIAKNILNEVSIVNCSGSVLSQDYNIEDAADCGFTATHDLSNTNPLLDAFDGFVYPLRLTSPALDSSHPTDCVSADQLGHFRPVDGNRDGIALCDRGAFELSGCGDLLIQTPEETCDDGNLLNGDGCDQSCHIEMPATGGVSGMGGPNLAGVSGSAGVSGVAGGTAGVSGVSGSGASAGVSGAGVAGAAGAQASGGTGGFCPVIVIECPCVIAGMNGSAGSGQSGQAGQAGSSAGISGSGGIAGSQAAAGSGEISENGGVSGSGSSGMNGSGGVGNSGGAGPTEPSLPVSDESSSSSAADLPSPQETEPHYYAEGGGGVISCTLFPEVVTEFEK